MAEWTVTAPEEIELVNGRPPYQWKHGWIPVSPDARAIKAKKKSGSAKDAPSKVTVKDKPTSGGSGKLTVDQALADKTKLPPYLTNPNLHGGPEGQRKAIAKYLEKNPEGRAGAVSDKPKVQAGNGDSRRAMSQVQRESLDDTQIGTPPERRKRLTAEWEKLDAGPPLDPDEQEALEMWQFGEDDLDDGYNEQLYSVLNHVKRGGDTSEIDPGVLDVVRSMDQTLQRRLTRSKAAQDTTLFRGIHRSGDIKVGDVLTDEGWAATSYNPSLAQSFAQSHNGRLLIIHAPKGMPMIRVPDPDEHEVLLGSGTPMRVVRIDGKEIHVEVGSK